jgi:hypothetical protein
MKQKTKLHEIWNEIGSPNMKLYGDRLNLQNKVFLLQELGLDLGYKFKEKMMVEE